MGAPGVVDGIRGGLVASKQVEVDREGVPMITGEAGDRLPDCQLAHARRGDLLAGVELVVERDPDRDGEEKRRRDRERIRNPDQPGLLRNVRRDRPVLPPLRLFRVDPGQRVRHEIGTWGFVRIPVDQSEQVDECGLPRIAGFGVRGQPILQEPVARRLVGVAQPRDSLGCEWV